MNTSPNNEPTENESTETESDGTAVHPHTPEERYDRSKRHFVAVMATSAYLWGLALIVLVVVGYLSCR